MRNPFASKTKDPEQGAALPSLPLLLKAQERCRELRAALSELPPAIEAQQAAIEQASRTDNIRLAMLREVHNGLLAESALGQAAPEDLAAVEADLQAEEDKVNAARSQAAGSIRRSEATLQGLQDRRERLTAELASAEQTRGELLGCVLQEHINNLAKQYLAASTALLDAYRPLYALAFRSGFESGELRQALGRLKVLHAYGPSDPSIPEVHPDLPAAAGWTPGWGRGCEPWRSFFTHGGSPSRWDEIGKAEGPKVEAKFRALGIELAG